MDVVAADHDADCIDLEGLIYAGPKLGETLTPMEMAGLAGSGELTSMGNVSANGSLMPEVKPFDMADVIGLTPFQRQPVDDMERQRDEGGIGSGESTSMGDVTATDSWFVRTLHPTSLPI